MKHAITTKKRFTLIIATVLAVILALSLCAVYPITGAFAEESDYVSWHETLEIANSQFANVGSGDIPQPNNWTGNKANDAANTDSVKSGVMALNTYGENKDNYKLDQYDEFKKSAPDSPFGKDDRFKDTNRNVLLINANNTETAYGYTSDTFTLEPNSYYRISAWVKTGEIKLNGGAAVQLNGFGDDPIGFFAIRTSEIANQTEGINGWFEYTMYVETSDFGSVSASLTLSLGYGSEGGLSYGYAMFDNITATQLSSKLYFEQTDGLSDTPDARKAVFDGFSKSEYLQGGDFENGINAFGRVQGEGNAKMEIIDAANDAIYEDNRFGIEKRVLPAFEKGASNKIAIVSTYNNVTEKFEESFGGFESNEFTVDRFAYYRLSAWYNSDKVEGGNGVSATVRYKAKNSAADFTDNVTSSLTLSKDNFNHNGWNELSIFVKGSDFADYTAKLYLSLGTEDGKSKGVAMFDEVKIQKITPAEYEENNANGNKAVTIDTITDSTGINNGSFNTVGSYEELKYEGGKLVTPLVPANWTKTTPDAVGGSDYSKVAADNTDKIVSGLVPFEEVGSLIGSTNKDFGNVLKLSSTGSTAFNYTSEDFTVAASSYKKLDVTLVVESIDGYGANIVLRKGGKVVSTIEKITESGTHTFYIKGGTAESTMSVELWLGMADRDQNKTKLASGTVYFTEVALTDINSDATAAETEFNDKANDYKSLRVNKAAREGISFATVNLGTEDFTLFDSYDKSNLKTPFNWSMTSGGGKVNYGIFDATSRENSSDSDASIPSRFDNKGKQYAVMLQNVAPTYSALTLDNAYSLAADSYYKLTVSVKTYIPEEYRNSDTAVGAYVKLSTGDYRFDFKSTAKETNADDTVADDEMFRTYTFYIKAPSSQTNVAIILGLGGSEKSNQVTTGYLFLNDITLESMSNLDYDEIVKDLKDDEKFIGSFAMRVDMSAPTDETPDDTTETETPENNGGLEWWLIPSILLAVAVVVAIVGSFIRKRIENRPKKAKVKKAASYDRRFVEDNEKAAENKAANENPEAAGDAFESFDDTADAKEVEAKEVTPSEPANVEPEETQTEEQPEEAAESTDGENIEVTEATEETTEAPETEEAQPEEAKTEEAPETEQPKKEEQKEDKSEETAEYVDDFED